MACNISNGASRPCSKINALLHRKECIYSMDLISTESQSLNGNGTGSNHKSYRLALGTNLGRVLVVTLKDKMSWNNTRRSFITEYAVGTESDFDSNLNSKSKSTPNVVRAVGTTSNRKQIGNKQRIDGNGKSPRRRKTVSSMRYSVLTARERCFRELADPATVTIDYDAIRNFLKNETPEIEEQDIREFFESMKPNKVWNGRERGGNGDVLRFCKILENVERFLKS